MNEIALPPVIAIDGPTASGKGTVAQKVARVLGWHYLDSGALYRLVALALLRGPDELRLRESDEAALASLAAHLPVDFEHDRILLAGDDVTDAIRAEQVGTVASQIAVMRRVREALVGRQRAFRRPPGLVADGRDMGTVIFSDAALKVFLTATPESRAERRYKQLMEKGFSVTLPSLLQDLRERDRRDASRTIAPLVPAEDAIVVDSTTLDIDQTVDRVLEVWRDRECR